MADTEKTSKETKDAKAAADAAQHHASKAADALDAKLSGPLAPLEKALDGIFGEKSSVQLPKDFRELLVKIAPWLSLVAGVLGIFSAIGIWRAAHYVSEFNRLYEAAGMRVTGPDLTLMFWLSIASTVVFAALALLAFPGLKAQKKVGWNLIFYSVLANIAYAIISLIGSYGNFFGALIGSVIGLFILFQIRSHYKV